jgi:hypothetical protein
MDTMKLTETQAALIDAVQECVAAEKALAAANRARLDIERPHDYADIDALYSQALDRVGELADRLPTPARSLTDVALRAQVAYCFADKVGDAVAAADDVEASTARLIEAVHEFAGIQYS